MAQHTENPGRPGRSGHAGQPRVVNPAPDPTLEALEDLSSALEEITEAQKVLAAKVGALREARRSGAPWHEILADEQGTPAVQQVSQLLARLSGASGVLRKELVEELRVEGVSIPAIARLFGVSHQRVSNLLRRD